jgi:hypothetical protein
VHSVSFAIVKKRSAHHLEWVRRACCLIDRLGFIRQTSKSVCVCVCVFVCAGWCGCRWLFRPLFDFGIPESKNLKKDIQVIEDRGEKNQFKKCWTMIVYFFIYLLQGQDPRWRRYQFRTAHLAGQVENRIGTSRQLGHFEEGNSIKKNTLDISHFPGCSAGSKYTIQVPLLCTWQGMVRLPVAFNRQLNI